MSKSSSPRLTASRRRRAGVLEVKVSATNRAAAHRLARDYSRRSLETVLAAFVNDMAEAAQRPGSWEHERVTAWLASHVWTIEEAQPWR